LKLSKSSDALIEVFGSKERVSYALPLILWIGVFSNNSGAGAVRRFVDAKIYLNMFSNIALHIVEASREKGLDVARIAARVERSREYITATAIVAADEELAKFHGSRKDPSRTAQFPSFVDTKNIEKYEGSRNWG
jgi:hypothetical protein